MLQTQVNYWNLQETKRHNQESEIAAHNQAKAALEQAGAAWENTKIGWANNSVNAYNATINAENAQTNKLNAAANLQNATSNAMNATTNRLVGLADVDLKSKQATLTSEQRKNYELQNKYYGAKTISEIVNNYGTTGGSVLRGIGSIIPG